MKHILIVLLFIVAGISSEENMDSGKPKEGWRLLYYAGAGRASGEFYPTIPFVFRDSLTGRDNNPAISKRTNTSSGLTPMNSAFEGGNASTQLGLQNEKWLFSYTYGKMDMGMGPVQNSPIPLFMFEGKSIQNLYNTRIDYNWKVLGKYTLVFSGRQFIRNGTYIWDNYINSPDYRTEYIAYPRIEVNDSLKINMFSTGFKIPILNSLDIEPYFQYRWAHYYSNVFPGIGATIPSSNFIPNSSEDILRAWSFQNLGSAYNSSLYSPKTLGFGNVGLRIQYNPVRFFFLRADIRRNFELAAWEVRGFVTMMFSKYFGITLGGIYAQPEINPLTLKAWEIGPTVVYNF